MKKILTTLFALSLILTSNIYGLNRDYNSYDSRGYPLQHCAPYCAYHLPEMVPEWKNLHKLNFFPKIVIECSMCSSKSIYAGYYDVDFQKYSSHLDQQINYYEKHKKCTCYWPELSLEAAQINDYAYELFKNLISTTALSHLQNNEELQNEIFNNQFFLNLHGMAIAFIAHQFCFSDYYHVCKDIENYVTARFNQREAAKIKDKLENILEALYPKFYKLHSKCFEKHSSAHVEQEIRLMKLLVKDLSALEEKMSVGINFTHLIEKKSSFINSNEFLHEDYPLTELESKGFQSHVTDLYQELECSVDTKSNSIAFSVHSEILLEQGSILNEFNLYKGAIKVLTDALKYNPSNRNAYIERAMAYFETNQIKLALKDYKKAVDLTNTPLLKSDKMMISISSKLVHRMMIYIPEQKKEFAKGLVRGILDGGHITCEEFIPSMFDCCRGILCGLWAFALSPLDVSYEMINATYAMGEYVAYHSTKDCLECVVPELRELSLEWNKLNDGDRGKKIGFIIGKYGLEVFGPLVAIKGINKFRAIKRANTMSTLQGCAVSQAERKKILEESVKRSILRETAISEAMDNGKILVRNVNNQIHIMQPKHKWHKLIELTGNIEVDCKNVIKLLEENQIFLKKHSSELIKRDGFVLCRQKMKINDHTITAEFFQNLEAEEMFLNNAWVGH